MGSRENLARFVRPGEIVKPWLILGPFYQDLSGQVQGLTLFERSGATVGRNAMAEIAAQAEEVLASAPREGELVSWRGTEARWSLVRRPEKYLSWGQYNISNHLGAAFLSTLIVPEEQGFRTFRLVTRIPSRVIVFVNGRATYDSNDHAVEQRDGSYEYTFDAALEPDDNRVTVGMFRLGRMAQIGCRLEVVDTAVAAHVPLGEGISLDERAAIEDEVRGLRLERDVFYPEHMVGIRFSVAPAQPVLVRLVAEDGEILTEVRAATAGFAGLAEGGSVPDGHHSIECVWRDAAGEPITGVSYAVYKVTPVPAPTGYDQLEVRKQTVLKHYAANEERRPIWTQVARYALGEYTHVDEEAIRDTCAFIAARKDCADFVIQGLLRLMYWERGQQRLSDEIGALMKDTVLGFKYWVDEPGDTVMYMGSENHRLLFHVAEWMAGQLYPTEEFVNSRQRGLYHATKGRMYITEWLRQRGRFGFDEWHSNSYYPISIAPMVNVYDFAIGEDDKLRQMAGAVLDYAFFNLAADSLDGVFGTTHGRSYGIYVKYPDFEGTSATCWLLYGTGSLTYGTSGMAPVTIATSRYQLPRILADIATDDRAVVESRVRQGVLRGTAPHANFLVYRTPDYQLSGLQDHRKGEYESSTHVAQVTLHNKAVVFWSCPHTSGEGSGLRPDYWSGHTTLPRVIQYRNVMSLSWRLSEFAWMTHCFFEQVRFDEVRFGGKWAFARVGGGYVGIYSQHGMRIGEEGPYAGRELICDAGANTWLVECGREADWGSFDAFVTALSAAQVEADGETMRYESPSVGAFVTGWEAVPTVNGEPVELHGYPMVDSAWGYSRFGSGELAIRYGDHRYEVWFNQ
jgi:hypothetical protein